MAALSKSVHTIGVVAAASITQGQAVTAAGAVATAAGNAVGVAELDAASGARVPVTVLGTGIAIAGAAITAGAALEVGSTGRLVTRSAGVTVARALTGAAANGDQIEVLLIPN